jgi:hypothetical protein
MHLRARSPTTGTPFLASEGNAPARLTAPLFGEGFDEYAAIHVETNHFHRGSRSQLPFDPVIVAGRRPRRERSEQGRSHCVLVQGHGHRVKPVGHLPYPAIEIGGLTREQPE